MNRMTTMILLGSPIENLGVEITPEILTAWNKLEASIAEIRASGKGIRIPIDYENFDFMKDLKKISDDQLPPRSTTSETSSASRPPKLLRKGGTCPACNSGNLIPIVYGMPGPELVERSERGEIELGGCVISGEVFDPKRGFISGDPELSCPKCEGRFFRDGRRGS